MFATPTFDDDIGGVHHQLRTTQYHQQQNVNTTNDGGGVTIKKKKRMAVATPKPPPQQLQQQQQQQRPSSKPTTTIGTRAVAAPPPHRQCQYAPRPPASKNTTTTPASAATANSRQQQQRGVMVHPLTMMNRRGNKEGKEVNVREQTKKGPSLSAAEDGGGDDAAVGGCAHIYGDTDESVFLSTGTPMAMVNTNNGKKDDDGTTTAAAAAAPVLSSDYFYNPSRRSAVGGGGSHQQAKQERGPARPPSTASIRNTNNMHSTATNPFHQHQQPAFDFYHGAFAAVPPPPAPPAMAMAMGPSSSAVPSAAADLPSANNPSPYTYVGQGSRPYEYTSPLYQSREYHQQQQQQLHAADANDPSAAASSSSFFNLYAYSSLKHNATPMPTPSYPSSDPHSHAPPSMSSSSVSMLPPTASATTLLHTAISHLRCMNALPFVSLVEVVGDGTGSAAMKSAILRERGLTLGSGLWKGEDSVALSLLQGEGQGQGSLQHDDQQQQQQQPFQPAVGCVNLHIDVGQFFQHVMLTRQRSQQQQEEEGGGYGGSGSGTKRKTTPSTAAAAAAAATDSENAFSSLMTLIAKAVERFQSGEGEGDIQKQQQQQQGEEGKQRPCSDHHHHHIRLLASQFKDVVEVIPIFAVMGRSEANHQHIATNHLAVLDEFVNVNNNYYSGGNNSFSAYGGGGNTADYFEAYVYNNRDNARSNTAAKSLPSPSIAFSPTALRSSRNFSSSSGAAGQYLLTVAPPPSTTATATATAASMTRTTARCFPSSAMASSSSLPVGISPNIYHFPSIFAPNHSIHSTIQQQSLHSHNGYPLNASSAPVVVAFAHVPAWAPPPPSSFASAVSSSSHCKMRPKTPNNSSRHQSQNSNNNPWEPSYLDDCVAFGVFLGAHHHNHHDTCRDTDDGCGRGGAANIKFSSKDNSNAVGGGWDFCASASPSPSSFTSSPSSFASSSANARRGEGADRGGGRSSSSSSSSAALEEHRVLQQLFDLSYVSGGLRQMGRSGGGRGVDDEGRRRMLSYLGEHHHDEHEEDQHDHDQGSSIVGADGIPLTALGSVCTSQPHHHPNRSLDASTRALFSHVLMRATGKLLMREAVGNKNNKKNKNANHPTSSSSSTSSLHPQTLLGLPLFDGPFDIVLCRDPTTGNVVTPQPTTTTTVKRRNSSNPPPHSTNTPTTPPPPPPPPLMGAWSWPKFHEDLVASLCAAVGQAMEERGRDGVAGRRKF